MIAKMYSAKGEYKIMKKNRLLRKQFAAVTASVLLTLPMCQSGVSAESDSWDVEYNPESYTLTLNGVMPYSDFVLMRIVPYRDQNTVFEENVDFTSEKDVVKTIEPRPDNVLSASILLPTSYAGERYIYYANTEDEYESGYLICADIEKIKEKLPNINSADASAMKTLLTDTLAQTGIDNSDKEKDMDYIAKLLVSFRPDGGYTADGFLTSYMQSEGVAYVKQRVYTMQQMLEVYKVYLDDDYLTIYSQMSENAKKSLEQQFCAEVSGGSFKEIFTKNGFLAEYWSADSTEQFKNLVLNYFKENNVSLDDYNTISNEYKKNTVFDELYRNRKSQKTTEEIKAKFDELVKDALKPTQSSGGFGTGGGPSSGGSASSGNGMLPPVLNTEPIAPSEEKVFSDMNGHWSKAAVSAMSEQGIIDGFADGTFRPDKEVTRAEFSKMISAMLGLKEGNNHEFSDVAANSWYKPYVSMTAEAGIVLGSDGKFMPEENITRQDAAVMLHRVLKYKGVSEDGSSQATDTYTDAEQIADYAKEAVTNLTDRGVLNGADGMFYPGVSMTRGEAAAMLYRILDLLK